MFELLGTVVTVKVVKGLISHPLDIQKRGQDDISRNVAAAKQPDSAITQAALRSPDAVINSVRFHARSGESSALAGGPVKNIEKAEKLANTVRNEILDANGKGQAESAHSGLRGSNAAYHL